MWSTARRIFCACFHDDFASWTMGMLTVVLGLMLLAVSSVPAASGWRHQAHQIVGLYSGVSFLTFVALATVSKYWELRKSADRAVMATLLHVRWPYAFNWPLIPVVVLVGMAFYYVFRGVFFLCSLPGRLAAVAVNRLDEGKMKEAARRTDQERLVEEEARRAGGTMGPTR